MTPLGAVQVVELGFAEARQLFVRRAGLSEITMEVDAEINEVVDELGRLEVAITLAGAHLTALPRLGVRPGDHLVEYQTRQNALLDRMPKLHVVSTAKASWQRKRHHTRLSPNDVLKRRICSLFSLS